MPGTDERLQIEPFRFLLLLFSLGMVNIFGRANKNKIKRTGRRFYKTATNATLKETFYETS